MKLMKDQVIRLKNECDTCFINNEELEQILKDCNKLSCGTFSKCYIDKDNNVLKYYLKNPHLDYSENGKIKYTYVDVIDNLINISKLKQNQSAIPTRFYVVDDELKMYKAPFMKGIKISNLLQKKLDLKLSEIKSAWANAYDLARYYSKNNIIMNDLNINNCNIYDGKLLIYDLDFYNNDKDTYLILLNNYELVNDCFVDFFKRYYFDFNYETKINNYYTNTFCEEFFDEFNNKTNKKSCKTLKEAYDNMHLI